MATATDTTPTPVIPFPHERSRKPDPLGRQIDDWTRARNAACAVRLFGSTDADAFDFVCSLILEGGANPIAHVLNETAHAIQILRGAVAELVSADRRISAAADRALAEAGL